MAHRVKCKNCNSCMNPVWVENNRYWHCWLCQLYYAGRDDELQIVQDPYKNLNKPKEIEKDDLNETQN